MLLDRRQFIRVVSSGLAATAARQIVSPTIFAAEHSADSLAKLDAVGQAKLVASGQISPAELLDAAIARIERLNSKINAVVTTDFDRASLASRENHFAGPFGGVPFLVKDLDDFAGVRTTNGARRCCRTCPTRRSHMLQACVDAGFNVVGKSNTPEFGLTGTTESLALGPCYNPWDLTRSSGGSSGGAGAAVAAGMVPMAQGSDGGGSIRIPACCCGAFGLKPSRGRMVGSTDEFAFSVKGAISRTVRDSAQMLASTERKQPAPGLKPVGMVSGPGKRRLKIGLYLKGASGQQPDADVADAVLSTARLCEELGHDVQMSRMEIAEGDFADDFLTLWSSAAAEAVTLLEKESGRKATHQDFEPLTLAFAESFFNGGQEKMPAATERLKTVSKDVARQMEPYDVVLCPVLSTAPPVIGQYAPTIPYQELVRRMVAYVAYTPLFNVTGMPAMSVPLYWNAAGLPIGSQFAAQVGAEQTLLELAYELEQARPWADKWAPYSAVNLPA